MDRSKSSVIKNWKKQSCPQSIPKKILRQESASLGHLEGHFLVFDVVNNLRYTDIMLIMLDFLASPNNIDLLVQWFEQAFKNMVM